MNKSLPIHHSIGRLPVIYRLELIKIALETVTYTNRVELEYYGKIEFAKWL